MITLLQFEYVNWRGVRHIYVVKPREIIYEAYGFDSKHWIMRADVLSRDGQPRRNVRSFKISGLEKVIEVTE